MDALIGTGLIAIGSIGTASFYVPFKKVKQWSWESYWLMQGLAAYLIIPWIFAFITVPEGELMNIFAETAAPTKWLIILFGVLWGIGGLTFGLSVRYLGIGLGQSVALGFTAAFGTLIPPLVAGQNLLASTSGILTVLGVIVCIVGIAVVGYAGFLKEQNLSEEERRKAVKEFALRKGILIAIFAGIMSACMNYGFEAGEPMAEIARQHGTNPLYASNPVLVFILIGGFATNFIYCVFLNIKKGTGREYLSVKPGVLLNNIFFTFLAGLLWFLQFHFYGMGRSQLPAEISIFGWSILMALNISFSNIWGLFLKEWKGTGRRTLIFLLIGIAVLIFSVFVVQF